MNPADPEFVEQLMYCRERLQIAYGDLGRAVNPDAAVGALLVVGQN